MTAKDSKSYLRYLNKLVDQYKNNYRYSVNKKPINADYPALTQNIESNQVRDQRSILEIKVKQCLIIKFYYKKRIGTCYRH